MTDVLTQAGSFVAIIVLGYLLKKIGFFKEEDFTILSKITIRITLPAAIITSFAGREVAPALLTLVLLGFGGGALYILLAFLMNLRSHRDKRAFDVLNLPGYNIGNFAMPFIQQFLGPLGVITTSLFDTGNAVICLGGALGIASMVKNGQGFSLKKLGATLLRSVPFLTYWIMVILNLLHISLPGFVVSCAKVIGNANPFVAMLMIGVGFKISGKREQIGTIARILAVRYGVAAVLAVLSYQYLPFPLESRQAIVILLLAPIGSAVPAFTGQIGGDVGLSSALNSLTMVISIVIIVILLLVML